MQWRTGLTANLSASGILFITVVDTDSVPPLDAAIEIKVMFPTAADRRPPRASCIGRIVRIEAATQRHHGTAVAVTIESYEIESYGATRESTEATDVYGGCTVH